MNLSPPASKFIRKKQISSQVGQELKTPTNTQIIFKIRETFVSKTSSYNLRRNDTFEKRQVHSVYHGTESSSFLSPKIRDLVPVKLKQLESLTSLKLKIKN